MALTAGTEIGFYLQADHALSYAQIETALTDAGFTNYMIVRSVNGSTTDLQITVISSDGPFDAADTLDMLAAATTALGQQTPA